ncbi:MAG: histidinol-phosphatase HisJ family protein [Clostridia bacterium]|nr:histidinol-phosphatase HisJ family protein [Clostridia bacterium]
MPYLNAVDLHTHTSRSFDCEEPIENMYDAAVKAGLKAFAVTDHLELDVFYKKDFDKTASESFADVIRMREEHPGDALILAGGEFGEAVYEKELSEEIINKYDYDIVIGSIHNLPGLPDFCDMSYDGNTDIYPLLDSYFDWELKMAQWAKFDTLAHLTYPLRYIEGENRIPVDLSRYGEIIDEILINVIKNKIALELNTSGYRQPYGKPFPDRDILLRYKQLGGKYLTTGSDAHYREHMGAGIARGFELALECGFEHITCYYKREPMLLPIRS